MLGSIWCSALCWAAFVSSCSLGSVMLGSIMLGNIMLGKYYAFVSSYMLGSICSFAHQPTSEPEGTLMAPAQHNMQWGARIWRWIGCQGHTIGGCWGASTQYFINQPATTCSRSMTRAHGACAGVAAVACGMTLDRGLGANAASCQHAGCLADRHAQCSDMLQP